MTLLQNRWNDVRAFYRRALPHILKERADEWAVDPYEWDQNGIIRLTPIEVWLWADIRKNNAILYPQFPVGRFFVDFANPVAKVAIECDGAAYHQDKARDQARDDWMEGQGWSVYRISGRDCRTDFDEETGKRGAADLFISGICDWHGIRRVSRGGDRFVTAADMRDRLLAEFAPGHRMPRDE